MQKGVHFAAYWVPKLLTYGFVFFLVVLEWLLRTFAGIKEEFIGPTLAAAAAGVLVPLINAKDRSSNLALDDQKELLSKGYIVTSKAESSLVAFIQFFLFILIALWAYDFYLVTKHTQGFFGISPFWLGMMGYFCACILAEVKEAV